MKAARKIIMRYVASGLLFEMRPLRYTYMYPFLMRPSFHLFDSLIWAITSCNMQWIFRGLFHISCPPFLSLFFFFLTPSPIFTLLCVFPLFIFNSLTWQQMGVRLASFLYDTTSTSFAKEIFTNFNIQHVFVCLLISIEQRTGALKHIYTPYTYKF